MKSDANILVFGDGESVLIQKRVAILGSLPQKKIFIQNSTGKRLSEQAKGYLKAFKIIEQPLIQNREIRYAVSFFLTLFFILRYRPSLIVVHWASRLYQNIIFRLFANRVFVTVMGGEIMPDQEGKHPKKRFYTKLLLDKAMRMTTESAYMKRLMMDDFGCADERILVCNFGVEESFYNPKIDDSLYEKLSIPKGVKVFFSMRAMEPFYQIDAIVKYFIEFKQKTGSNAVLIVTANRSSSEYLAFIEGMVNSSFMQDSIKIVKDIIHEDIDKYISLSHAVISMAPSDGLPHTMLECLAAKKFMIFRNLPQYGGFLEHQNSAFLVDDEQTLIDAFLYVEKSESLEYTPSKEALLLIDKNVLTKKYLAVCEEIISYNGEAA